MNDTTIQEMKKVLDLQKQLHIKEGPPSLQLRKDRLERCILMIKKYQDKIISSLQQTKTVLDPFLKSNWLIESMIKNEFYDPFQMRMEFKID